MSSAAEDAVVKSSRPLACDFRRLRFSRNARFSRSWRRSFAGLPGLPLALILAVLHRRSARNPFAGECDIGGDRTDRRNPDTGIPAGKMVEFEVMVRPIKALATLGEERGNRIGPQRSLLKAGRRHAGKQIVAHLMASRRLALAPVGALWQGSARLVGAFLANSRGACCRSSVVEHSIGNGEVDSSILSGSTIQLIENAMFSLIDLRGSFPSILKGTTA